MIKTAEHKHHCSNEIKESNTSLYYTMYALLILYVIRFRTIGKNIEAVKETILDNRRITIREVANDVGIPFASCQAIFTEVLGMKRAAVAKIVLKLLNIEQKQRHMDIDQEMFMMFNDDPDFLIKIIVSGESWVCDYDIETKSQQSLWKRSEELKPNKARQVQSNVKVSFTVFFDYNGMVYREFLSQGFTSNKDTTLKLSADCAKQYVRNADIYIHNRPFCLNY